MFLKGFREFINESTNGAIYADLKLLLELGITDDIQYDMYRGFNQGSITHDELLDWVTGICNKYSIKDWTLNREGLVDVNDSVYIDNANLIRLPIRFGNVTKSFYCYSNQLTTLEGAPRLVGDSFYCEYNYLTTLEGAPQEVGGNFYCLNNQLTRLEGAPQVVGRNFYCHNNYLTTLKGAPKAVGKDFACNGNPLTSLAGIGEVGGKIYSDIK